jgi:hypothetical protein
MICQEYLWTLANPPEDMGCGTPDPHPVFKKTGRLEASFSVITRKLQVSYENLPPPKKGQRRTEGGFMMEENTRIGTLIEYWMKHNEDHAESYIAWAAKAANAGNQELSRILVRIYLESKRLNRLLEAAKKAHC